MGLPKYLAATRIDDPERTVWLADEMLDADARGPVVLLQCGRESVVASELGRALQRAGRRTVAVQVRDRATAQSDQTLARMAGAAAVWVFADDMFETFLNVFATQLAFHLRTKARAGLPVIGVGGGALSLGGLMLASRVCHSAQYDLVAGLGWAARTFVDGDIVGYVEDDVITKATVTSLPGLLGIQLAGAGAVRVQGGRVESIGTEPICMLGSNGDGNLLVLPLEPGKKTVIAPPPFAPFERGLLPPDTLRMLGAAPATPNATVATRSTAPVATAPAKLVKPLPRTLREAPPPPEAERSAPDSHAKPGSGRYCPMCKRVHGDSRIELAA